MSWGSLENFIAMGGYGAYVWGSYGVTLAAVALELWSLRRRKQRALAAVERAGLE